MAESSSQGSASMVDLVNATKAQALNLGALAQAFQSLASSLSKTTPVFLAGTFTLTPSATTTIVSVSGVAPSSLFYGCPTPLTANAANDMATTSYAMGANQFTITHASNSRSDRTFSYLIKK